MTVIATLQDYIDGCAQESYLNNKRAEMMTDELWFDLGPTYEEREALMVPQFGPRITDNTKDYLRDVNSYHWETHGDWGDEGYTPPYDECSDSEREVFYGD